MNEIKALEAEARSILEDLRAAQLIDDVDERFEALQDIKVSIEALLEGVEDAADELADY